MYKKAIIGLFLSLIFLATIFPQKIEKPGLRIAVKGKAVYVYQSKLLPSGYGFNIYRKNTGMNSFKKLNDNPVTPATDPSILVSDLGNQYDEIADKLETSSPVETFLKLKTDPLTSLLYTYVYPGVAKALGRLFIDSTAKIGSKVTYKVIFVNDQGITIDDSLIRTVTLRKLNIISPSRVTASNEGHTVTLKWDYPAATEKKDDKVISFNIYRKQKGNNLEKVNNKIIIRDADKTHFKFSFNESIFGRQVDYYVTAQAITGQESKRSKKLIYFIKDNIPPHPVSGLKTLYENKGVTISWNVSPSLDAKGYNIYRSQKINEGFKRLNTTLINSFNPFFRDTIITGGMRYFYKVDVIDSSGNKSERSVAAMIRVPDNTPPKAPSNLKAVLNKSGKVQLSWYYPKKKANDFRSFIILRTTVNDKNEPYTIINSNKVLNNNYTDPGITTIGFKQGFTYGYALFAEDKAGNRSDTIFASVKIPDTTAPKPPAFLKAKNVDGIRADIRWSASPSTDVVQYKLYRSTSGKNFKFLKSLPVNLKSCRDPKVSVGNKYYYSISAVDSVGNEGRKSKVNSVLIRDFDPPQRVRNVRAGFGKNKVVLNWEPVFDSDLQGYDVYRSKLSTGNYKLVAKNLKKTKFIDKSGNSNYWYIIKSEDTSGNESRGSIPVQPEKENVSPK